MEGHLVNRDVESREESCELILDRAIQSLMDLRLSSEEELFSPSEIALLNEAAAPAPSASVISDISPDRHARSAEDQARNSSDSSEGSRCVDLLLQEMTSATSLEDAKMRATRFLETFEKVVESRSATAVHRTKEENSTLQMRIQQLLKENQILKRGVAIQHGRLLAHEHTLKELQTAKELLVQDQAKFRSIEMENYTLSWHLRRAQERVSIPERFHPYLM